MIASTLAIGAGVPARHVAPGAPLREHATAVARADTTPARHVGADLRFVRRMIGHHAQALEMTALVPTHGSRADIRLLAQRIDVSQRDEIALMRQWLERHGAAQPDSTPAAGPHAMSGHDMAGHEMLMPGMLTARELSHLADQEGPTFDRLFLEDMIRHHEGALTMVAELLAAPGAAQEPALFRLVSDIDADQRAEIRRMRAMLLVTPARGAGRH